MKIFQVFETVLVRLSDLPGLKFLQTYVISIKSMETRFGQRQGDYEAFIMSGQNAMNEVKAAGLSEGATSSAGGLAVGDDSGLADDDYDFYDDYEDEAPSRFASTDEQANIDDNYPVSDDLQTYYDDDYNNK